MKRVALLFLTVWLFGADKIVLDLKHDLSYFQEVATKTKANEFYQPHIISVYLGKDLEKAGILTLKEALKLIPGVDLYSDNLGNATPIFRGSNPLAYGQSLLFIDGVKVNDVMLQQFSNYLSMPIELIKRIEVIRGPGSKAESVNAYAGAIYVTTYAESLGEKRCEGFFARGGSERSESVGFFKRIHLGDLGLYFEFYAKKDDKSVKAGPDIFATGVFGSVNKKLAKKGDAPLWEKTSSFAFEASYKDLHIKGRALLYKHGMGFGLSYALPQKRDFQNYPSKYLELDYKKEMVQDLAFAFQTGIKRDLVHIQTHVAPPGLIYPDPFHQGQFILFKKGFFGIYDARQKETYTNASFTWSGWQGHKVKIGSFASKEKTYKVQTYITDRTGKTTNIVDYTTTLPFFDKNAKRERTIFYISDDYDLGEKTSLYYGINIEKNSQTDFEFNPRISGVYRIDSDHILKILYSRSLRNPSWQELFTINNTTRVGNPHLRPEIVHATELSYIQKFSVDEFAQISLFFHYNKDLINNINPQREFRNSSNNHIYGFELEYKKIFDNSLEFYGNYSYVMGKDGHHRSLANVSKHLAKALLTKEFTPSLDGSLLVEYASDKGRVFYDERKKLKGYITTDMAINYHMKDDWTIQLALKNIFQADIRYPSPPNTYVNDYPATGGRAWYITLKKVF